MKEKSEKLSKINSQKLLGSIGGDISNNGGSLSSKKAFAIKDTTAPFKFHLDNTW